MKSKHKDEKQVQHAISLPKDLQDRAFAELKKDGIFKANSEILKQNYVDQSKLHRERNQGKKLLKMCSECKGFFSSDMMYKHKRHCKAAEESTSTPTSVSLYSLMPDPGYTQEYKTDILNSFRESAYGDLIRNDEWIKTYGSILYENIEGSEKKIEKRISLTSKLRRLAHLFLEFKKVIGNSSLKTSNVKSCSEMFDRSFIRMVQTAITNLTVDKETNTVKSGLKVSLRYLINDVCEVMQANYLIKRQDDKAEELAKFIIILKTIFPSFFKDAEESVVTKRQAELRAPVKLPSREGILILRDSTKKIINECTQDVFTLFNTKDFCKLRDALVCRLTLFNARRGGEPSRMRLAELEDAINNKWVDKKKVLDISDELEKNLLCQYKIAYIRASKLAKLVPVILPEDCQKGLALISDPEVRRCAGVKPTNNFVFPNTMNSNNHVGGWDCVSKMCKEAGLEHNINATGMRHYIATEYALLDVPSSERDLFYKHMGHSEKINENVYQCPPAMREITKIGKVLKQFDDSGIYSNSVYPCPIKKCDS